MALPDGALGQLLDNLLEIQIEPGSHGVQVGVEFGAHSLDLGVGLLLDLGEKPRLSPFKDDRIGQTLTADVGAAGVVGVVHPQAGGLVLAVEGDEFDVEQGEELALGAFLLPFSITVKAIEVIDTYHLDTFFPGHVEGLLHIFESTEGIRGVQMGVDIKNLFHMNGFK